MPIFNSLGSNYSLTDALAILVNLLLASKKNQQQLIEHLSKLFKGKVNLFYKGRDALEYILLSYDIGQNDCVLTQAFACYAIEDAIKRTGALPVYADLTKDKLYPDFTSIAEKINQHRNIKAVLLQFTFGSFYPQLSKVQKLCQEKNIILIIDLAQAYGSINAKNTMLGTGADAVLLSFGRDKIIDAIAGGASILISPPKKQIDLQKKLGKINWLTKLKDASYPLITYIIRQTHGFGFGKVLHFILKKVNWLQTPLFAPNKHLAELPNFYATMAMRCLEEENLDWQLSHRRLIANLYYAKLKNLTNIQLLTNEDDILFGSNLRFAIASQQAPSLLDYLAKEHIYLHDSWYKQAVDCSSISCQSIYVAGSCPNAEALSKKIINLPTHQQIDNQQANKIIKAIESWHELYTD